MIGRLLRALPIRRHSTAPPERALDRRQGAWLLGGAALTLAPHALWLPAWVRSCSAF